MTALRRGGGDVMRERRYFSTIQPRFIKSVRRWRVSVVDVDEGCAWCGERPSNGHLFAYFEIGSEADYAVMYDAVGKEQPYCGLHCWGQDNGGYRRTWLTQDDVR